MPYPMRVKSLAYKIDPDCWKSYSGQPIEFKRRIDARRTAALAVATKAIERHPNRKLYGCGPLKFDAAAFRKVSDVFAEARAEFIDNAAIPTLVVYPAPVVVSERSAMPPMKIAMMLHFYACCEPFAPEKTRTSNAYVKFVRELLRDDMIKRPTKAQRRENPGWAYTTTDRGRVYVEALKAVPLPVQAEPKWVMPT